jgi:hypothetical protein
MVTPPTYGVCLLGEPAAAESVNGRDIDELSDSPATSLMIATCCAIGAVLVRAADGTRAQLRDGARPCTREPVPVCPDPEWAIADSWAIRDDPAVLRCVRVLGVFGTG